MSKRAEYDAANYVSRVRPDETLATLATETSRRFHDLMDAAMLVSFYKYGAVADAYPEKVNAIESLKLRLDKYAATGNAEYLVDVANFAMIEFMHPANPDAFYKATDKDGSPGRVAANDAIYDKPNQYANRDLADADEKPF